MAISTHVVPVVAQTMSVQACGEKFTRMRKLVEAQSLHVPKPRLTPPHDPAVVYTSMSFSRCYDAITGLSTAVTMEGNSAQEDYVYS